MSGSACCLIFLSSFLSPFFAFYQSVYFFLSWLFFLKYHLENVVLEIRVLTGVHPPVYLLFGLFIDQRGEKNPISLMNFLCLHQTWLQAT